jgi:G3E family GTPase
MQHIPVTILTGFLGSGKTTLVNRILKDTHDVQFALIVNEFGEIGIDAGLIRGSQDFVKMDNGCLCCVLNEELEKTIVKLIARDDYQAVILESTGVADPLPIAWTFLRPQFGESYRFAGIITVVDCLHLENMLTQADEVKIQIERADYLYLAKTDLCNEAELKKVKAKLLSINANARMVDSKDENWLDLIFDVSAKNELAELHGHQHEHTQSFQSVSIDLDDKPISLDDMEDLFESLPKEVFRAKAVFKDEQGRILVMHAVCGRVDFYEEPDYTGKLAAVFIGKSIDEEKLKENIQTL